MPRAPLVGACAVVLIAQTAGSAIRRLLISTQAHIPLMSDGRTLAVALALALPACLLVGIPFPPCPLRAVT